MKRFAILLPVLLVAAVALGGDMKRWNGPEFGRGYELNKNFDYLLSRVDAGSAGTGSCPAGQYETGDNPFAPPTCAALPDPLTANTVRANVVDAGYVNVTGRLLYGTQAEEPSRIFRGYVPRSYATGETIWDGHFASAALTITNASAALTNRFDFNGESRWCIGYQTTNLLNGVAGVGPGVATQHIIYAAMAPRWTTYFYSGPSAITNTRVRVMMRNTGDNTTDGAAAQIFVGWRYSTSAGDTNWIAHTANGVTLTSTDTGVAYAANTAYKLTIDWTDASTIRWLINDVQVASVSGNLPTSTTTFTFWAQVTNLVGGAGSEKNLRLCSPWLVSSVY